MVDGRGTRHSTDIKKDTDVWLKNLTESIEEPTVTSRAQSATGAQRAHSGAAGDQTGPGAPVQLLLVLLLQAEDDLDGAGALRDLAALGDCCLGLAKVPGRQHVCVQSVRSSVQRGNNFS